MEATTKVVTGVVRLSYAHIWEPASVEEGGEKKYSAALIISKDDTETIKAINAAVEAAKEAGKVKLGGKTTGKMKLPLRDGDEERPDDEAYANSYFLNASSKTKPGIVDKFAKPIMEQDMVYSGCHIRASINFYAFNTSGNKGIACGLNHIMFIKDGERLAGGASAESDFAGILDEKYEDEDFM